MPNFRTLSLLAIGLAGLAACSPAPADSETADDFAARVNGAPAASREEGPAQPATPPATAEGKIAEAPRAAGATGLSLPADAQSCNAPAAREFLNRADSPQLRSALAAAVAPVSDIRFLQPGSSGRIGSQKDRLNVMIDVTGTIRDLRCG